MGSRRGLSRSRFFTAAAALAGAAIISTMSAAPTPAALRGPLIVSGDFAGNYGTGCTYRVMVQADPSNAVLFLVDGEEIGWSGVGNDGFAWADWTPTEPGLYLLQATQNSEINRFQSIEVGFGLDLGSSCIAF